MRRKTIRINENDLRNMVVYAVRSILTEDRVNNNLTFGEYKKDMEKIGFQMEKLARGSAWMFKLIEPYNGSRCLNQVDAHDDRSRIDGNILKRTKNLLNEIGWFKDPDNFEKFPFDKWGISRDGVTTDTTQKEIDYANELYKDTEILPVFPIKDSICVINANGKFNLCNSTNDRRPLLDKWYDSYGYDRKTHKIPCLKYDNMDTFETECYPIRNDGTIDTENVIIENKKYYYEKNRII